MQPARIERANVRFGGPGYTTLDARRDEQAYGPEHTVAFQPSPEEIEAIVAGASVHLTILGEGWPPVRLSVGGKPE